jgi:hypothetical protein
MRAGPSGAEKSWAMKYKIKLACLRVQIYFYTEDVWLIKTAAIRRSSTTLRSWS